MEMNLILATLIVGATIYGGAIVLQYLNYSARILPCISRLEEDVVRIGKAADTEEMCRVEIRDRIGDIRTDLGALQRGIVAMQGQVQAERERKQRLDMALFMERFKSGRLAMVA